MLVVLSHVSWFPRPKYIPPSFWPRVTTHAVKWVATLLKFFNVGKPRHVALPKIFVIVFLQQILNTNGCLRVSFSKAAIESHWNPLKGLKLDMYIHTFFQKKNHFKKEKKNSGKFLVIQFYRCWIYLDFDLNFIDFIVQNTQLQESDMRPTGWTLS